MKIEKEVTLEEVSHKDIGKPVSFKCHVGSVLAEFSGTLGGIDRLKITLKGAQFRKSGTTAWAPTAQPNPELEVESHTVITVYVQED